MIFFFLYLTGQKATNSRDRSVREYNSTHGMQLQFQSPRLFLCFGQLTLKQKNQNKFNVESM